MAAYEQSKLPTMAPDERRVSSVSSEKDKLPHDHDKLKYTEQSDVENRAGGISDSEGEIGRQIELESENTIKYRTCSWQKVCILSLSGVSELGWPTNQW